MRIIWLGVILNCLCWISPAQSSWLPNFWGTEDSCSVLADSGFVPAKSGLEALGLPIEVLAASPSLTYHAEDGTIHLCSSSVVSDDGTILTAGHCALNCMQEKGAVVDYGTRGAVESISQAYSGGQICTYLVDGKRMQFIVERASFCHINPKLSYRLSPEDAASCVGMLDYAILKPLQKSINMGPCLKLSDSTHDTGAVVAAIGNPAPTKRSLSRPEANDSDGNQTYLSFGTVVNSETCKLTSMKGMFGTPTAPILDHKAMLKNYIQLGADMAPGDSGGGIVDPSGDLLGVGAYSNNLKWETTACPGSSFATSISAIRRELTPIKLSSYFHCSQNAAVKHGE